MILQNKVLKWNGPNTFELEDRKLIYHSNGDALLRIIFTSICGSDLRIARYGDDRIIPPRVLGHEMVAEVIDPGSHNSLKVNDIVAVGADIPCGDCHFCKIQRSNLCETHLAFGYQIDGGFEEFLTVPASVLNHIPIVKIESKAMLNSFALAEPTGCAINGLDFSKVQESDTVLIYGGGPIGIILALLANKLHNVSVDNILIIEPSQVRREFVEEFGLEVAHTNDFHVIKEKFPHGATKVFTATSAFATHLDALGQVQKGGAINFFGGVPKDSKALSIMSNDLHYREISIGGSHGSKPENHRNAVQVIKENLDLWNSLITLKVPLNHYVSGFQSAQSSTQLKVGFSFE
jgi:L-iditol 2-dehydrogenase